MNYKPSVHFSEIVSVSNSNADSVLGKTYSCQSLDASSTTFVINKLSTTRKMLERTLKKNHKLVMINKSESEDEDLEGNLHHQLGSPTFSYLNQIYEAYCEPPVSTKVVRKKKDLKRNASVPSVFLKTKEKMMLESEEKFKKECTFRPAINNYTVKNSSGIEHNKATKEEWLENLSKSKAEVVEQRQRLKREEEERLSKSSGFGSIFKSTSSSRPEERLYTNERKGQRMEQLKREKEEKEASAFKFSPHISKSSIDLVKSKNSEPLYLRINQVQEERKHMKKQLQSKFEQFNFKPYISDKSARLAGHKCSGSVIERLSKDSSISKSISETPLATDPIPSKKIDPRVFLARQSEYQVKSQKEKQELQTKSTNDLKFHPEINENSNFIINCKHDYNSESQKSKILRMTTKAIANKLEIQSQLEKSIYSNLKFTPEINQISKKLAGNKKLSTNSEDLKEKKRHRAQASLSEIEKLCSFSPILKNSQKFGGITSKYSQSVDIMEEIQKQRDEKVKNRKELRSLNEDKDFNECTFKPKRFERIGQDRAVCVKGVERFYELRNLANRQKYEKEERERKVLNKN